jgi:hypothetical protein
MTGRFAAAINSCRLLDRRTGGNGDLVLLDKIADPWASGEPLGNDLHLTNSTRLSCSIGRGERSTFVRIIAARPSLTR